MKKSIGIVFILASVKLIIQLIGNRNYGFHRDELLHLSVSEHMAWGFMEFPPFIAWIGKVSHFLFDYSLVGTRLFPTIAGVIMLILCCLMAKEFRESKNAIIITGVCFLGFLPFYRNHMLFQPVAFDQLFWTLDFYYLIRFINTKNKNYLLLIGVILGVGLMNKYTILVWAFGVFIGMIYYQKGKVFKDKWWYLSGLLALLIALPNIIWQVDNNFPLFRHVQELQEHQSQLLEFGLEQLNYPLTLTVSIIGVAYLLNKKEYKPIGISVIIIFSLMWLLPSKPYYVFSLYPVLFAAGATQITDWLKDKRVIWQYLIVTILLISSIPFIPYSTPILPIQMYTSYAGINEENGHVKLTSDYADMFGWDEQVRTVDSIFQSLTSSEKSSCVLWAENYGEAGALKILGKKHGLPNPISRHGSFWNWGYNDKNAKVWISIGNEKSSVEQVFQETQLIKILHHKYAIDEENGIPIYICRDPKVDIDKWWKDYESYIFY